MPKKKNKRLELVVKVGSDVVDTVVDEIEAIVIELSYVFNNTKIEMFWKVGKTLRDAVSDSGMNVSDLVASVAADNRSQHVHMYDRSLWFALKLYDSYPADEYGEASQTFPGGKDVTLTKMKKLLMEERPKIEPTIAQLAEHIFNKLGKERVVKLIEELKKLIK